jgi:hypothetical protein
MAYTAPDPGRRWRRDPLSSGSEPDSGEIARVAALPCPGPARNAAVADSHRQHLPGLLRRVRRRHICAGLWAARGRDCPLHPAATRATPPLSRPLAALPRTPAGCWVTATRHGSSGRSCLSDVADDPLHPLSGPQHPGHRILRLRVPGPDRLSPVMQRASHSHPTGSTSTATPGPGRSPRLGGDTGSHLYRGDNPAQLAVGETGDRLTPAQFRRYLRWPLGNA